MSQRKKPRLFTCEYKSKAVERMLAGESPSAIARELKVLRKLLYEWKDAYIAGGSAALRRRGRPPKNLAPVPMPEPKSDRADLLQARKKIAELERVVGKQVLQLDFFAEALRRIDSALQKESEQREGKSIRSSSNKHCKAD
jgi:transposase